MCTTNLYILPVDQMQDDRNCYTEKKTMHLDQEKVRERDKEKERECVCVLVYLSVCACVVGSRNIYVCETVCVGLCVKKDVYLHVCVCRYAYVPVNHLVVMIKINTRQKISKGHITYATFSEY